MHSLFLCKNEEIIFNGLVALQEDFDIDEFQYALAVCKANDFYIKMNRPNYDLAEFYEYFKDKMFYFLALGYIDHKANSWVKAYAEESNKCPVTYRAFIEKSLRHIIYTVLDKMKEIKASEKELL